VKGRALKLLADFRAKHTGLSGTFMMSRLILRARIIPERITPELDDPEIEARIEAAIARFSDERDP
jgi:hypothetical protein